MNRRASWAAVAAFVALHVAYAGLVELAEDEAYYWVWSRRLALGYFDHPPAVAWLIRGGTALLGDTERGVRLLFALAGGLVALAAAPLARDRLLAVLILGSMPLTLLGGIFATPDVPLGAAWALGLCAAARGRWGLAGAAAGLAMLSKYTGVLLLPVLLAGGRPRGREAAAAALVALAVYAPNAAWNLAREGLSWRFQLAHAAGGGDRLGFAAAQWGLVGPLLFPAAVAWLAIRWKEKAWTGDPIDRLCWWSAVPLLAIAAASGGEANWAAPGWIGPAVGLARSGGRLARLAWVGIGVDLAIGTFALVHAVHPLVRLPVDPVDRLRGGRILGESVAAWGVPHVYTSRYQEAARIHFYGGVPARPWPGTGRRSQYDLWPELVADRGLFVRPWADGAALAVEEDGYDRGGGNAVTAYADTPDPREPRLVARWQVYEIWRKEPEY